MSNRSVKTILFDLGGVLIDFQGLSDIGNYIPETLNADQIRAKWVSSPSLVAFEHGQITMAEFTPRFVEEWNLSLPPEEFGDLFSGWIKGPLPGMETLLKDLRPHFTLACLSNTNAEHWDGMISRCGLGELLDAQFASHLIGKMKPQKECFEYVCDAMALNPEQILFFDDGMENVDGAREAGLHAFQAKGPIEVRNILGEQRVF
ncbi:MAG: HAD family hydrolase [Rhizobiaceae bacterium]